jgi:hypothetical protein
MNATNTNDATPVIRTDFTDEAMWTKIQRDVAAINKMGFSAKVRFVNEQGYSGLTGQNYCKVFQVYMSMVAFL